METVQAPAGCEQLHPAPANPVAVSPAGTASLTVTVPLLTAPPALLTLIVYVAPTWPALKLPAWVLVRARSGPVLIAVASLAVFFAPLTSPPPDTLAVLVTLAGGPAATFTVRVSGGEVALAAIAGTGRQAAARGVERPRVPELPLGVGPPGTGFGQRSLPVVCPPAGL